VILEFIGVASLILLNVIVKIKYMRWMIVEILFLKTLQPKLLQKKVHPREGEGFGLHYVYTYDKIPTDEQLSSSFLVYVCCEEVEFEDPKDILIKLLSWQI